jgi:hypothetical protein
MPIKLPLQSMSVEDKLEALELIWDDICMQGKKKLTPDWHGSVLHRREADLQAGKDWSIDWEKAKRQISGECQ